MERKRDDISKRELENKFHDKRNKNARKIKKTEVGIKIDRQHNK